MTRRKRRQTNEKSLLSESTDDEGESVKKIKTRRSRSSSIEVSRKRGRPRKNQQTLANNEELCQKK